MKQELELNKIDFLSFPELIQSIESHMETYELLKIVEQVNRKFREISLSNNMLWSKKFLTFFGSTTQFQAGRRDYLLVRDHCKQLAEETSVEALKFFLFILDAPAKGLEQLSLMITPKHIKELVGYRNIKEVEHALVFNRKEGFEDLLLRHIERWSVRPRFISDWIKLSIRFNRPEMGECLMKVHNLPLDYFEIAMMAVKHHSFDILRKVLPRITNANIGRFGGPKYKAEAYAHLLLTAFQYDSSFTTIEYLVKDFGAPCNIFKEKTILIEAIRANNLKLVQFLIEEGKACINFPEWKDKFFKAPLAIAIEEGHIEIVEYLLSKRACLFNIASVSKDTVLNALEYCKHYCKINAEKIFEIIDTCISPFISPTLSTSGFKK